MQKPTMQSPISAIVDLLAETAGFPGTLHAEAHVAANGATSYRVRYDGPELPEPECGTCPEAVPDWTHHSVFISAAALELVTVREEGSQLVIDAAPEPEASDDPQGDFDLAKMEWEAAAYRAIRDGRALFSWERNFNTIRQLPGHVLDECVARIVGKLPEPADFGL